MKKILLLLVICLTITLQAQDSKEIYGRLHYAFVPHNLLQGVGYAAGYQWHADRSLSYKLEFGMLTTFRNREMDELIGNVRYMNLYYNLAQMNVTFLPTMRLLHTKQWELSAGLGVSAAYQSRLFTISNYAYRESPTSDFWQLVTEVDAAAGLRAGVVGAIDISYQLSGNWAINLSTRYHAYYQGEMVLEAGIGAGYRF